MDLAALKDWLIPLSTVAGVVSAAIAAFQALRDYKLKLQAEARLAEASRVEADVKLLKLFVELMDVAHARGPSVVMPENLFEKVWPELQKAGSTDPSRAAVITMPVGGAAQDAAIAAVAALGRKHPILRPVALQALASLAEIKPEIAGPLHQSFASEA